MNPKQRTQVPAQAVPVRRTTEHRHGLEDQRLVDHRKQNVYSKGNGIGAVLCWNQPARQQHACKKIRTGDQSLIQYGQPTLAHPGDQSFQSGISIDSQKPQEQARGQAFRWSLGCGNFSFLNFSLQQT